MPAVYTSQIMMSVVTLSGTAGTSLTAPGTVAGDVVMQAFDLVSGADVQEVLAPRAPADGKLMQLTADESGHLALVLLRRMVPVEQVIELVPAI